MGVGMTTYTGQNRTEIHIKIHTHTCMQHWGNLNKAAHCINVNIFVILCYSLWSVTIGRNWVKGVCDLSVSFLTTVCESTLITKEKNTWNDQLTIFKWVSFFQSIKRRNSYLLCADSFCLKAFTPPPSIITFLPLNISERKWRKISNIMLSFRVLCLSWVDVANSLLTIPVFKGVQCLLGRRAFYI